MAAEFSGLVVQREDFSAHMHARFDEIEEFGGDIDDSMANYLGDVYALDLLVGKVLEKIDELGLREDTIVVFSSDNGPAPAASPPAAGGREAPRGRFGIDGYKSIEAKRALMSATVAAVEIARLEELARRGWPPLEVKELDGWILGMSGSYTRRANAVWPVRDGERSLVERVEQAETFYAARDRRTVFKLQPAARPSSLDEFLDKRGYRRTSETIVETLDLHSFPPPELELRGALSVDVQQEFEADWFDASASLGNIEGGRRGDYRAIVERLGTSAIMRLFGRADRDGRIASLALGCVVDDVVSIVEVATAQQDRGQRLADYVLRAIIEEARSHGTTKALLSVEADNSPARRLYGRLGFVERYRYWYRES